MFLSAAEAAALLGVKPATLYAYVSRGLIRSEPGPAGSRRRRYHAGDIQALQGKQGLRRDPAGAVQASLHGGLPLLESALTALDGGQLRYRGHDAALLAETATVEEVAALLWTGKAQTPLHLPLRGRLNLSAHPRAGQPLEALAYALTHAAAHDLTALDLRPEVLPHQAARVLSLLYATLERHCGVPPAPDLTLHLRLARALGVREQAELLRRALVLLADHELNVSTFAARVTASSGASLHHATLAALCALQGPKHGLAVLDAFDLLQSAARVGPRRALRQATRQHAQPPGFGHPLYPQGDPRAAALLGAMPESPAAAGLIAAMQEETGQAPNVDLALAALTHWLRLSAENALTLFALARAVGWLAHSLETVERGEMIRPRARYVGDPM